MNAKQVKKVRQLYKRDLRKQLLEEISLLKSAIKPKPKLMPKWIYRLLALVYVRKNYRDKLFGK